MKRIHKLMIICSALLFVSSVIFAGEIAVDALTTFVSNTPALAAEVNDNFTAVKTAVNDNNTRVTDLETEITGMAYNDTTLQTDLNADMLDGSHASAFASSSHNHDTFYVKKSGDTMTGTLSVTGNVQASGDFTYASAKTHVLNLSVYDHVITNYYSAASFQYFPVNGYGYVTTSTGGYAKYLTCPIRLPHGAVIKKITAYFYDNHSTSDVNISIYAYSGLPTATSDSQFTYFSKTSSSYSSTVQSFSTATLSTVVDENRRYYFYVYWNPAVLGSSLRYHGAQIQYTISTVAP